MEAGVQMSFDDVVDRRGGVDVRTLWCPPLTTARGPVSCAAIRRVDRRSARYAPGVSASLVHRQGEFAFATRAAIRCRELLE
jgi:hypothetical protein